MRKLPTQPDASKADILGVTSATMKRILSQPKPGDLIALYIFLAATAHRQRTQKVFCTIPFIARGLGWSVPKVKKVKQRLRELDLLETFNQRDRSGRIKGWYVLVRYLVGASRGSKNHPLVFRTPNALYQTENASDTKVRVRQAHLSSAERDFELETWTIADKHNLDGDFVQAFVDQHSKDGWTIRNKLTGNPEPIRHLDKALLAFCEKLENDRGGNNW